MENRKRIVMIKDSPSHPCGSETTCYDKSKNVRSVNAMRNYLLVGSMMMVCMGLFLSGCHSQNEKTDVVSETTEERLATSRDTEILVENEQKSQSKETVKENEVKVVVEASKESLSTTKVVPTEAGVKSTETVPSTSNKEEQQKVEQETPKAPEPPKSELPKPEPVQPEPPKIEEPEPVEPEAPKPVEPKPEVPKPVEPKPEALVSFDVSPYVSYANSYAQSIGLATGTPVTDCWDNPISANAGKQNIKGDIQSRLNRYKNVDECTGVWIWTTKQSESDYLIYIGYY